MKIKFYSTLRGAIKKDKVELELNENMDVRSLILYLSSSVDPKIKEELIDSNDNLIPGTMILINGKNINDIGKMKTQLNNTDNIDLFPPAAGG